MMDVSPPPTTMASLDTASPTLSAVITACSAGVSLDSVTASSAI